MCYEPKEYHHFLCDCILLRICIFHQQFVLLLKVLKVVRSLSINHHSTLDFSVFDQTWCAACCIGDSEGAHNVCSLNNKVANDCQESTWCCFSNMPCPCQDQSEQWRQFMLCSMCDHHTMGEWRGSEWENKLLCSGDVGKKTSLLLQGLANSSSSQVQVFI